MPTQTQRLVVNSSEQQTRNGSEQRLDAIAGCSRCIVDPCYAPSMRPAVNAIDRFTPFAR